MDGSWDRLRFFIALATHGTHSEAARRLGVSHSTVQRQINALETELNVKLFHSTANGYQLSKAGRTLFSEASQIPDALARVSSRIAGEDDQMAGTVTITVSDTVGFFLLPDILRELSTLYPHIRFDVLSLGALSNLANREADIAIRISQKPPEQLIGRQVGPVKLAVCASVDYLQRNKLKPETAIQAARHFVVVSRVLNGVSLSDWVPDKAQAEANLVKVNGFLSAWRFCHKGIGVALLPEYILAHDKTLKAVNCDNLPAANSLWVLCHQDLRDSARAKAVRQYISKALSQVFGDNEAT